MFEALAFAAGERGAFELTFVDGLGEERYVTLRQGVGVAFEDCTPVRMFPSYRGQRNFPGWWWSATSGEHVEHESWLERDHAMLLDFDPRVVGFTSQPFRLHWLHGERFRHHVPDFFARLADGTGVVIDVRADSRIEPVDADAFAATEAACAEAGWVFRRVGELAPVFAGNVRWLSRYRRPRCAPGAVLAEEIRKVFTTPTPLFDGAGQVGDTLMVLPAVFHLLWRQALMADLETEPLNPSTAITVRRLR